jgi:hypothetical protein
VRLEGRPARAADVAQFYPDITCSFRAWVAELDGEPKGIIGVALLSPIACMFSAFAPELRPHLKRPAVLRLIKKAEGAVKASPVPVWAVAQEDEPTAPGVLERLGFIHLGEMDGDTIYEWRPSGRGE